MREPWEDGEEEFNQEEEFEAAKAELLSKLEKKYFLIGMNNSIKFINIMVKEKIPHEKAIIDGFDYEELEKLHDKFIEYGVSAIFMPFGLMKEFSNGEGLSRLYKFDPVKGEKREGILIPVQVNISEGRPNRKEEISDKETEQLSNMLDALNSGNLSFDDFLRLT